MTRLGNRSKYHSQKTAYKGYVFDSKREAKRYAELLLLEQAGEIHDLQRQVVFPLIPSQKIDGRVAERKCDYRADFVYYDGDLKVSSPMHAARYFFSDVTLFSADFCLA